MQVSKVTQLTPVQKANKHIECMPKNRSVLRRSIFFLTGLKRLFCRSSGTAIEPANSAANEIFNLRKNLHLASNLSVEILKSFKESPGEICGFSKGRGFFLDILSLQP